METKLIIPVVDTERGKFEYNGRTLTREEYGDMEYDHFRRTDRQVGRFVENMAHGISNIDTGRWYSNLNNREYADLVFIEEECNVLLYDSKMREIDEDFLIKQGEKRGMFLLIVNINPDTLPPNAESEIRFWMRDSNKVINDPYLPEETKLKTLLGRDYKIKFNNRELTIYNCKMVQNFSNKRNPFKFAIIVEKSLLQ